MRAAQGHWRFCLVMLNLKAEAGLNPALWVLVPIVLALSFMDAPNCLMYVGL